MGRPKTPSVFIVSDGRGETCAQYVKAALVQFEGQRYRLVRKSNVRTPRSAQNIVKKAAEAGAIIFYTLVEDETRKAIQAKAEELLVPTVDVLAPAFSALRDLFKAAPGHTPGLLFESEREHLSRMDSIDYTLKHDDGQRPFELDQADVVLVGVSRAAKSSTCFFLAYQGIRAANVPLLPGVPPLQQLVEVDPAKVIGLKINVMRLRTVREVRAMNIRMADTDPYVDKRAIAREVREANRVMDEHGWRSIDVSYMAVEEIAREVVKLRNLEEHTLRLA
jgi:regulator of PEP synthase PpsR (kinase-PPPase family)